ncbi:flavin reductase family protein [Pseudobutyrivibrio xylanivorans]|uniref:Flavin reductase family protein n=1 Tax=Pseudobutyrivibrio xylanivorans TaxID=185007 RepID=A0A5P6VT35_PSEXY|nr:flavin reductase family protein [Pseudobutyrivibrio xylanivorans]QFJ54364.1 flavin reductase family protein [Pseudobutyrivibrio xylanivorans]
MHTFQPYPINMLEWNPIKKLADEGVAIVTEADGRVNATSSHNGGVGHIWGKNVLYAFLRNTRYTKELLDKSDYFSACFFDMNDINNARLMKVLDQLSGRNEDKLAACRVTINHALEVPYIDDANFIILCRKIAAVPMTENTILDQKILNIQYTERHLDDFHTMYIGEILDIRAR